jgi:Ca-activated chloride channel family protein
MFDPMKGLAAVCLAGATAACGGHGVQSPPAQWIRPETIQRVVRARFSVFRRCYEAGLYTNPELAGLVAVRFVIDGNGEVHTAADGGSTMPDASVVECVVARFRELSFPHPDAGEKPVTVVYPIQFKPEP